MRIVFIMDPMARLLPEKDTSVALIRAAQDRAHQCFVCDLRDLSVVTNMARVFARPVQVRLPSAETPAEEVVAATRSVAWYTLGPPQTLELDSVDAVFVRKDPPFDSAYLSATLLLERARGSTLIVNDPRGLRDANEKLYALHFAKWGPRTVVSAQSDVLFSALDGMGGRGVLKPLDGAGGHGVFVLDRADANARSIVDHLTAEGRIHAMLQEYLPAVREGDKRILLLAGKPLGAINRVPRSDDFRSNIHAGGAVQPTEVTARELEIVKGIVPRLLADGLFFVGLDVIGGTLTEVNVTSPTGIQELSRHVGRDVAANVIEWTEGQSIAFREPVTRRP
jgi:glutathione synthase